MRSFTVSLTLAFALGGAAPVRAADAPPAFERPAPTSQHLVPPAGARPNPRGPAEYPLLIRRPGGVPLPAFVVEPAAGPRHPAVLWVHWLGEPETTNHTEFLADARALAEHGVVSLLVDMPWSQPKWFTDVRTPATDYDDVVAQVVSLRGALDLLEASPQVDAARIAYVGHDFGAMDGGLLLAADDRVRYAVLMAPTLSFWEWDLLGAQPADRDAYVARMSAFDLPRWLPKGHQRATLLQFANHDDYVAQATASAFRNAVPNTDRTFKRYDTDHALADPQATADRRAWLLAHLGGS